MAGSRIYTVTQLNQEIKNLLESNPAFFNLFVQGEISNHKLHSSGHHYLTIKDMDAAINAVMFRSDAAKLRFRPQNGMKIVARGRISSFPKSGQVQFYIADMMPDGAGMLHMQFEQRKEKLFQEGLFDTAHKRPLPDYPECIALITSPTGAAVHDMLRILARRWPMARVQLFPALVQGKTAAADLVRALLFANGYSAADLIILGRGGGSLEDLWAFNDEQLARAIYASRIPVVSAVGHEPDVTIADFVADLRAPTPSGAAELSVPDRMDVMDWLMDMEQRLTNAFSRSCRQSELKLETLEKRLSVRTPLHYLHDRELALHALHERIVQAMTRSLQQKNIAADYLSQRSSAAMVHTIAEQRAAFQQAAAQLDALSPLKVLSRGYAVASDDAGKAVTDASTLTLGDTLHIRMAKGSASCEVRTIEKARE